MSTIFLSTGTARMGITRHDAAGNVTSHTPPSFEPGDDGGCVAIGKLNPETMEPDGPASIYGDYDAAGYLAAVVELLKPSRQLNIPDLKSCVIAAAKAGDDDYICEHCNGVNCRDCIITEWKEEAQE